MAGSSLRVGSGSQLRRPRLASSSSHECHPGRRRADRDADAQIVAFGAYRLRPRRRSAVSSRWRARRCAGPDSATSLARRLVVHGIAKRTGACSAPTMATCHSGTRGSMISTGSPRRTPRPRRALAKRTAGTTEVPERPARLRGRLRPPSTARRGSRSAAEAVDDVGAEVEVLRDLPAKSSVAFAIIHACILPYLAST